MKGFLNLISRSWRKGIARTKRSDVKLIEVAKLKDILNGCGEVDMALSGQYDTEEMACQIVLQFVDDGDIIKELYELSSGKEYNDEIKLMEVQKSLKTFFTLLPEIYMQWIKKYLYEKHMQYVMGMKSLLNDATTVILEKLQTATVESFAPSQKKE